MTQTAVEWLFEQLDITQGYESAIELLEKAKAIEKEQIIEAHEQGFYSPPVRTSRRKEAEEYYNETFKSE
jgi:hypothetical protein